MAQPITERTKQWITRPKKFRIAFYLGCIVIAALAFGVDSYIQNATTGVLFQVEQQKPGSVSAAQSDQLDALVRMNQLITTLGTTLIGALGFLLVHRKKSAGSRGLWPAAASFICVGLSIYFGYTGYNSIIGMLQNAQNIGWFNVTQGVIPKERAFHFYFLLLGAFFFADFAFHEFNEESAADAFWT